MNHILKRKLKFYTKESLKFLIISFIAIGIISAIILIKYKPIYKVKLANNEIGYVQNKKEFEETLKDNIQKTCNGKVIDNITFNNEPSYELSLIERNQKISEEEVLTAVKQEMQITYQYFEIALDGNTVDAVNTKSEAEDLVKLLKQENSSDNLDLSIIEKYTQNENDVKTNNVETVKVAMQNKIEENKIIEQEKKEEEERQNAIPSINGIKLAVTPISGTITSRYGAKSRIRKSTHTGLDIAATKGTPIKVVADGTVTCASYQGSYGNLVKVDHGNGVETWYAHTSKMNVKVGQKVLAGDIIATVGSTGNSTGPHLHLEVRINGEHVDPSLYFYK